LGSDGNQGRWRFVGCSYHRVVAKPVKVYDNLARRPGYPPGRLFLLRKLRSIGQITKVAHGD
jgi:hypothetical protein